ncbi:hypothetical protein AAVH_25731 [Aphelenchoides avenae]|nr:hypothetical protein AAVH_25731 [Aphelenchus avenae]
MRSAFFVVLLAVSRCLANPRYGLMSGQMPLGDEYANFPSVTPQKCGELCGARSAPGLLYHTGTSNCTCYAPVKGYADVVDSTQLGYIRVDDTSATCPSMALHRDIIRDMVYGGAACPPEFTFGSYCENNNGTLHGMSEAECAKYGAFVMEYVVSYTPPHCHLYVNGTVV